MGKGGNGDAGSAYSGSPAQADKLVDTLINDSVLFARDVSVDAMAGAARELKLGPLRQSAVTDKPATGVGLSVQFVGNSEVAAGGGKAGAQVSDFLMDAGRDDARVLRSNKHLLLDTPQALAGAMVRSQAASSFEFSDHVIVPASLHALRAGWSAGLGEEAGTDHVEAGNDVEPPASDGMTAINGQAPKSGGRPAQGPAITSTDDKGGNANVLSLDRMAAEVAEERMGMLIAQRMVSGIRRGEWRIHLLLKPESLGEVRIEMRMQGNAVEAQLSTAHDFTKNVLNHGLDRLRDCLRESGMEFASIHVSTHSKESGDGKPTGKPIEPPVSRTEIGVEDDEALSPGSAVGKQSGSQWDMFV